MTDLIQTIARIVADGYARQENLEPLTDKEWDGVNYSGYLIFTAQAEAIVRALHDHGYALLVPCDWKRSDAAITTGERNG